MTTTDEGRRGYLKHLVLLEVTAQYSILYYSMVCSLMPTAAKLMLQWFK